MTRIQLHHQAKRPPYAITIKRKITFIKVHFIRPWKMNWLGTFLLLLTIQSLMTIKTRYYAPGIEDSIVEITFINAVIWVSQFSGIVNCVTKSLNHSSVIVVGLKNDIDCLSPPFSLTLISPVWIESQVWVGLWKENWKWRLKMKVGNNDSAFSVQAM